MRPARIGAMRHRIRIERPVRTPDGGGGASIAWRRYCDAWAEIEPVSGGEGVVADGLKGRVSHAFRIRYRPGITPAMRALLGSRRFDIRAVLDIDERRRFARLLVEETTV